MNEAQETPWPAQGDTLDFPGLIGLDEIDVSDFPIPDSEHGNDQFAARHPNTPYDGALHEIHSGTSAHDFATDTWTMAMEMDSAEILASHAGGHDSLPTYAHQVAQQVWDGTPQMSQSHMDGSMGAPIYSHASQIPPTPNSYEMHGADAHLSRQRQAFMEQQVQHQLHMQQNKRENFTPLGTPAVTPQESGMSHPSEYAVPGTYFSPLTSPALQAQNAAQQYRQPHPAQLNNAMTSAATSPMTNDLDIDMFVAENGGSLPERSRKPTKKAATSRTARTSLRQSPAIRAQKRKSAALSTSVTAQDLENIMQDAQAQPLPSNLRAPLYHTDSSGAGSISPEPLSEALMGPPPRPGISSNTQSPTITAQSQRTKAKLSGDSAAPATPASLMSIDKTRQKSAASSKSSVAGSGHTRPISMSDSNGLEDFVLPPSASGSGSVPTPTNDSGGATPRIDGSRKTPKLGPLSTASSSRALSTTASPVMSAVTSPVSATVTTFGKDGRGRNGKKRESVSGGSTMVSPALRPKISPSIKPLLPEGANLSDSQQAYLLASKSNYTHLLEGTLLPGVSYPDSLSSGLTSKRTSHKIAEQGRRNRINEALKEMQSLLPPPALRVKQASSMNGDHSDRNDEHPSPEVSGDGTATKLEEDDEGMKLDENVAAKGAKDKDADRKSKDSPKSTSAASEAKAANSKAATVENAIEYIRALQKERVLLAEAMQAKDSEMNELRRKLRDAEFKLGGTPSNSTASTSPEAGKSDT